ncbi:UNVERIFIED_CONTAM: hypothetical protein FKN15_055358 [Acipenser sinensis]
MIGVHNEWHLRRWECDRAETLPSAAEKLNASNDPAVLLWEIADKAALRKSLSADERLLQQQRKEQHKLLSRLEKGRSKLRNIHVSAASTSFSNNADCSHPVALEDLCLCV